MASEIRVNQIQNRSGLTTTTFTDTGVTISGILTVSENLNVGGVVTYEDVTNIDSVGVITARSGLNVVGNDLNVGSNIKIGNASGIVTATTFSGSGASLTNLPAGNLTGTLPAISGANLTNLDASDLASGTVPTARLGSGTANNTTFLRGDSTFQTVNTDLVSDTSPQLGGNLDTNSKNILFGDTSGSSNNRLKFGAGPDLEISHNGTDSIIQDAGTGDLKIGGSIVRLTNAAISENMLVATENGAVELYHDNSIRAETISDGFRVKYSDDSGATTLKLENNSTANSTNPKVKIAVDLASGKDGGSIEFIREQNYQSSAAADSAIVISPTKNDNNLEIVRINQDWFRLHSNCSGIQFNSDTASANALNDYEEGTFTPRFQTSNGNWGGSMSSQNGSYTKIGNVVHVTFRLHWGSVSGSGNFRITALPFTVKNVSSNQGGPVIGVRSGFNYPRLTSYWLNNSQQLQFQFVDASGPYGSHDLSVGALASTGYVYCSGWYETA